MKLKKGKLTVWDELYDHEEIMSEVVEIVEKLVKNGEFILPDNLVKLLAYTKSQSLYELVKTHVCFDDWGLIDLFLSKFPDPEIEVKLLEKLYEYAGDDSEPRGWIIAEAMRDVGTSQALETLQAILYDQVDSIPAKQVISEATEAAIPGSIQSKFAKLVFENASTFNQLIEEAIDAIKVRGDTAPISRGDRAKTVESENQLLVEKFTCDSPTNSTILPEIAWLVEQEESETLEFKSTLRLNMQTKQFDGEIELAVIKTVAAFLNTKGGTLLVGISDDKKAVGVEQDKFLNEDKYNLHFWSILKSSIPKDRTTRVETTFKDFEGKRVFQVTCRKSEKAVYVNRKGKGKGTGGVTGAFFVRTGPSTARLEIEEAVDYIKTSFSHL